MTQLQRRVLFWIAMLGAQVGAFIIFKDLADISQWVVQSSREFTMAVWYNRYLITGASIALLVVAVWLAMRHREVCPKPLLVLLVGLCLFNIYSGMINPNLMFRPQQHAALFVPVDEAPKYMQRSLDYARFGDATYDAVDDVSVLVLETDNGAYAYSDYYLLQPHVAKGDTVGGEEVIMTYCGLTNLGIAYSPVIGDQNLELSVMTQLKNNLVLKDSTTGEPIQQLWGTFEGDRERGRMKEFATIRMPFRSFRELYPDGKVFVNEIPSFSEQPLVALWDRIVRHGMMYWGVGLQWRYPDKPAFPTIDDYVAYTKDFIVSQGGNVNVTIGGRPVVIDYDASHDVVTAFFNSTGAPVTDVDVFGRTPSGQQLERVNTLKSDLFWFIFAEFYPQTDVNRV